MAHKVHVSVVYDLDGTEAPESVKLGPGGVDYEITVSDDNASRCGGLCRRVRAPRRRSEGTAFRRR